MTLFAGDRLPVWESEDERRAVLAALKAYRARLRMSLRANARKGWRPGAGRADTNLLRLVTVNRLIARWLPKDDAGDGDSALTAGSVRVVEPD